MTYLIEHYITWGIGSIIVIALSFLLDKYIVGKHIPLKKPIDFAYEYSCRIIIFLFIMSILPFLFGITSGLHLESFVLIINLCITSVLVFGIKIIIRRKRPVPHKTPWGSWSYSFPSMHAALAFNAATASALLFPILLLPFMIYASLIAISRIHFQYHFLSDTLAGTFIGISIGLFVNMNPLV